MKTVFFLIISVNVIFNYMMCFDFYEYVFGPKLQSKSYDDNWNNFLSAEELIKSYGYQSETHQIVTEDEYILTIHRIPFKKRILHKVSKPIALIHHGLLASSDNWLFRGPDKDLPYLLSEAGYDVWLCNARGNFYSRGHIRLNANTDIDYWKFSFHEMALYDLPATINYILNKTKETNLYFIGHSMGATISLILCANKPEYNKKFRLIINLAVTAYPSHKLTPFLDVLFAAIPHTIKMLEMHNIFEFLPRRNVTKNLITTLCQDKSPSQNLCLAIIFLAVGFDYEQFNKAMFPSISTYYPAGTSVYTILHYYQMYKTGFLMPLTDTIDKKQFKNHVDVNYTISQVTAPMILYYGDGDFLVTKEDNEILAQKLSNVVGFFGIPYKHFNHLDFMWGKNSKTLLYEHIIAMLNKNRYAH